MPKVDPETNEDRMCDAKVVSLLFKIALALACLGFVLVVVPCGFDRWLTYTIVISNINYRDERRVGIFYACSSMTGCEPDADAINQWQLNAAYIYATAIILIVVTVVAMVIYCLKHSASWAVYLKHVSNLGAFISWIFLFASDFLLVANRDNLHPILPEFDIDWALIVSICGAILFFVVNILVSIDTFFFNR